MVQGEGDSLDAVLLRVVAEAERQSGLPKVVGELRPGGRPLQGFPDGMHHVVTHCVHSPKAVLVHGLLALGKVQAVFRGQFLAHLDVAHVLFAVLDGLALVVDPVGNDVTMGMALVEVPEDDELRVLVPHPL